MQNSRGVEIWVGVFVALGLVALFGMAMWVSNLNDLRDPPGYTLTAYFENVGGLKPKGAVALAGVTIGRVTGIQLDEQTYRARVTLRINREFDTLPEDTSARIQTSGLLGDQFIGLEPGGSKAYLKDGDVFDPSLTQSALVLEQIIGQFLFSKAAGDSQ